jgi:hypothetical protein
MSIPPPQSAISNTQSPIWNILAIAGYRKVMFLIGERVLLIAD